jgi:dihydrofolate synthase / folylpolyglutamate synthase
MATEVAFAPPMTPPMADTPLTLDDWLAYQQRIHPAGIVLGLDRVREVAARLGLGRPARCVLTIAGTNGKGSTVAFAEAIARAAGLRVGAYTSPHLLRYNERIRIDGADIDDAALITAFEAIEAARDRTALTCFEFGTLAALWLFERAGLDLAILEVGLGGRLDAVNLVDADVAVLTTVDLDHVEWLGNDREAIGREKAGVFRTGRPAVLGECGPPDSVLATAAERGAVLWRAGIDFSIDADARGGLQYSEGELAIAVPAPALAAPCQPANAAAAICALRRLPGIAIGAAAIARGVATATVPGRLQRIKGPVEIVLDVAHNPQAAEQLAQWLRGQPVAGRTLGVFSALGDKDLPRLIEALIDPIDCWHLAGLPDVERRGLDVETLWQRLLPWPGRVEPQRHASVAQAFAAARADAVAGDRVVVFGSFHTVGEAVAALDGHGDG